MRHVDLFSGIGGFALAATWVWGKDYHNLGHSEIEKFPCKVYHKHFPESECLGDITKIDWRRFEGQVDLLTGGFPCQPHSVAGKRKGSKDERDLWGECVRALSGIRPRYAIFENVPGIITSEHGRTWEKVKMDLDSQGYEGIPVLLSAQAVGAPHRRWRVWIFAYDNTTRDRTPRSGTDGDRQEKDKGWRELAQSGIGRSNSDASDGERLGWSSWSRERIQSEKQKSERQNSRNPDTERIADTERGGEQGFNARQGQKQFRRNSWRKSWIEVATALCRVDDGLPRQLDRVQRLKALGNAIVPQCAEVIMRAIKNTD